MYRLAALLVFVLAACGPSPADLEGDWVVDVDAADVFDISATEKKTARDLAEEFPKLTLKITADEMIFKGVRGGSTRTYEVKSQDGSTFTLETTRGRVKETVEFILEGDSLLAGVRGQRMPFKRR